MADHWSSERYASTARFVSDLGQPVLELLGQVAGQRVLDLGCGDGILTARLAEAGADVLGIDSSPDMVAAARGRGIDAVLADAHELPFKREFDAVFSNAALHWMTQPDRVIAGVGRVLKPGGRFAGEFGGMGNVAAIRTAIIAVLREFGVETDLRQIWYFPTPDDYAARLERGGFDVEEITLIPRPTPVEAGIEAWLATLAAPAIGLVAEAERPKALSAIADLLAPALRDEAGVWRADYVRLRFLARLRGEETRQTNDRGS